MSSTNKTTYYDLPQYVDNDIFNPLVDDNDAYSKIDTALHNIANAEADDANEIVSVKGRLDSAEGAVDALEAQNGDSTLTTTAQTLSGAVNELDGDISALAGRVGIVEDDINNASTGLKVKVASLDDDVNNASTGLKTKVSALETQNGDSVLTTTAQTLSGAVNELDGDISSLVTDMNTKVKTLRTGDFSNRKFAFQSDSYLTFVDALIARMGLQISDCIRFNTSGGGFAQENESHNTFVTKLAEQSVDTTVTDFVIIGGVNDAIGGQSDSAVGTALDSYFPLAKTKYPNAKIWFIPCQHLTDTQAHALAYLRLLNVFRKKCGEYNVVFFHNAPSIFNSLSIVSGDRQHISLAGFPTVADYVINALKGGNIDVSEFKSLTMTQIEGVTAPVGGTMFTQNGITHIFAGVGNSQGAFDFNDRDTIPTLADLINVRTPVAHVDDIGGHCVTAFMFRTTMLVLVKLATVSNPVQIEATFELRDGGDITMLIHANDADGTKNVEYIQTFMPIHLVGYTALLC